MYKHVWKSIIRLKKGDTDSLKLSVRKSIQEWCKRVIWWINEASIIFYSVKFSHSLGSEYCKYLFQIRPKSSHKSPENWWKGTSFLLYWQSTLLDLTILTDKNWDLKLLLDGNEANIQLKLCTHLSIHASSIDISVARFTYSLYIGFKCKREIKLFQKYKPNLGDSNGFQNWSSTPNLFYRHIFLTKQILLNLLFKNCFSVENLSLFFIILMLPTLLNGIH